MSPNIQGQIHDINTGDLTHFEPGVCAVKQLGNKLDSSTCNNVMRLISDVQTSELNKLIGRASNIEHRLNTANLLLNEKEPNFTTTGQLSKQFNLNTSSVELSHTSNVSTNEANNLIGV